MIAPLDLDARSGRLRGVRPYQRVEWRQFFHSTRFGSSMPTSGVFTPGNMVRPTEFQAQPGAPVFRRK